MEPNSPKWVGSSCGLHGPYVFYKAFKFARDGRARILSLGDFFFVRCKPEDPVCVAELQLLWEERSSKQLLSSSKLYFLPEDTPQGRTVSHGEHEVIAVTEKVTVRLKDLVKWTVPDASAWSHGLKAEPLKASVLRELGTNGRREALHRYRDCTHTSGLNFRDVQRERAQLGLEEDGRKVLVLSYPQYCRFRSMLLRLRGQPALLTDHTVLALGGIATLAANSRVLYCRDTFDHPALLHNQSICDQFAPNLKGRPRKKKLSISQRRDSSGSNHGSTALTGHDPCGTDGRSAKVKPGCKALANGKMASKHKACSLSRKSGEEKERDGEDGSDEETEESKKEEDVPDESREEEQAFLVELYKYMKERDTPIERIPFLGFKQINLWTMFQAAQKLGGYELITVRRQWKHVYDELGGNPSSTSAATCTRRHYERLLLPYERHLKGESDKPLPLVKPRKEGCPEKLPGLKAKGGGAKKPKSLSGAGPAKEAGSGTEAQVEPEESPERQVQQEALLRDEPIVIEEEEEEELHLTLKKEESSCASRAGLPLHLRPGLQPEWRRSRDPQSDGHFNHKSLYAPPRWDLGKAHVALPETTSRFKDLECHGGRVGKVLPICKPVDLSSDPVLDADESGGLKKEAQMAAYCQGVMSPLAKKKLLSQVCESRTFSYAASALAPALSEERRPDTLPEVAPVFRPSVIQHAQSSKHGGGLSDQGRTNLHSQGAPWQPYLARSRPQEEAGGGRGYDGYSSPHLHSLYRQTESCLGQERLAGGGAYLRAGPEPQSLAFRSHDGREVDDEPRDFSVAKPLSHRVPSFSYLDSHPKACRVPPMSPKASAAEQASADGARPAKRGSPDHEAEDGPERKVRVVTPVHPACAIRRGDPEELKPAEPAHAAHLDNPASSYSTALYSGLYPPGLVTAAGQDGLQRHPGLQYLKSQSAVSPLVPPLAFHSMMLQRHLLASNPGAHHFYRHPGGAAIYGDLLHHLYPLSNLPPPQLSSAHPSTRL